MHKDTRAQAIEGFFIVKAVEISPNTVDLYKLLSLREPRKMISEWERDGAFQ